MVSIENIQVEWKFHLGINSIHLNNQYKYPRTDNVIALKLAIDGDERKFNRQANASTIHNSAKIKEHWDKMRELKKVA